MSTVYACCECGVKDVKLWRGPDYTARCVDCTCRLEGFSVRKVRDDGRNKNEHTGWTDQIKYSMPAIPRSDGLGYWPYTSVPAPMCEWWRSLPLRTGAESETEVSK